jgi:arginase
MMARAPPASTLKGQCYGRRFTPQRRRALSQSKLVIGKHKRSYSREREGPEMRFAIIAFRYATDDDKGAAAGPDALLNAGLTKCLGEVGHEIIGPLHVELGPEEEAAYGSWNKIGLANARLAQLIFDTRQAQAFPILLESNCYAAIGALAGLVKAGVSAPRLGMVWIDAHGDCNTPETTLSGMLSGMPVAIATGQCLHRFRQNAGLEPPLQTNNVVMVCVRANDPLEQELIDQCGIPRVPVSDVRSDRRLLCAAMDRLSDSVDAIYVHFDIDALDASELALMRLAEPNGPMRDEMAKALEMVMAYSKVAAFGISDFNPDREVEGQALRAILAAFRGAIAGVVSRSRR